MMKGDIKELIFNKLSEFPYKKDTSEIIELFTKILNYRFQKLDIPKEIFPENIKSKINNIKIISEHSDFKIFFIHLDKMINSLEREIIKKLELYGYPYGLFIFSDEKTPRTLHFVNVKYEEKKEERQKVIRRMIIEEGGGFRTYSERLSEIEIKNEKLSAFEIQHKVDEAFDVDKVTEEFFTIYKEILDEITNYLIKNKISEDNGRFFGIQLLNRMMFIYFIQKKGWLYWKIEDKHNDKPDKRYLYNFYLKYKQNWKTKNSNFYRDYLSNLFFFAFNHNYSYKNLNLPDEIKISFSIMPYLNGGLFTKNKFDEIGDVLIKDEIFENIFENLLERFNFTIREDLPFDIDVAVDPEMLGKVYESLVHGEEIQERRKAGIFYTPRVEIDYMIKMSLVENLNKNLDIDKKKLIKFIFSEDKYDELTEKEKFEIKNYLENIKILDPAVGSGSFLVRAMNILVNLFVKLGYETKQFNLRKNIIKNSLYGVDVIEWAVRVAELRLWLNLLIDIDKNEIDLYTNPLLPNLSFKIRQGDSLNQEIFGKYISLREPEKLSSSIKKIIDELVKEKRKFFDGESERENIIRKLENDLIRNIFEEQLNSFKKKKNEIQTNINKYWDEYTNKIKMFGEDRIEKIEHENIIKSLEKEKEKINSEIDELKNIYEEITKNKDKQFFLWDIDFSDVFGEKGGFDLVIGNPPYVRQELIGPPLEKNPTREQKDIYKKKLQEMVEKLWKFRIGGRCDLYVYFYFLSLSLLNNNGTFCFINSNSFLDVDFGKYLQEFLLKNFEIKRIIDNQVKRSFKEADINTVIVLISKANGDCLNNKVKFIMYKKPFEEGIKLENEIITNDSNEIFKNDDFRVFPKSQKELLLEGIEDKEPEEIKLIRGKYEGGKWGGIYLRAPDIYFTILEKGRGKFIKLGDIAEVRFGIKTGANEFFYVEDVTDKFEDN
ncbi:MAG: Eco57I restriction-modification methylase domain-containing protein [Caldisericia bacterium]